MRHLCGGSHSIVSLHSLRSCRMMPEKNQTNLLWRDVHAIVIALLLRKMFYCLEMSTLSTAKTSLHIAAAKHRPALCCSSIRALRLSLFESHSHSVTLIEIGKLNI